MNSRIALIAVMTAAMTAGGLMAKDVAPAQSRHNFMDRLSTSLNMTDQQKQEAKSIFTSERQAAKTDRQELRQERKAVHAAIQSGKPVAEIEKLAKSEGPTLGALAAKRAETSAKFYAMLTPAQQQKLVSLHQEWRQKHAAARQNARNHANANNANGNNVNAETR